MKKVKEFFLVFLLCLGCVRAQENFKREIEAKSFDYIHSKIREFQKHDSLRDVHINAYLNKAKSTNDSDEMFKGYYFKGVSTKFPISVVYFDSALAIKKKEIKSLEYFPRIHLEYGKDLYENGNYTKALNHYVQAKEMADSIQVDAYSLAANTNIAFLKEISGDYGGAKNIYLENSKLLPFLFKDDVLLNERLSNYHELAYAYLRIGQNDSSSYYTRLGYVLSKKSKSVKYPAIYRLVEGINHFEKEEYQVAQDSLQKTVEPFKELKDSLNLAFSYLYLGKIRLEERDTVSAKNRFLDAYKMLNGKPTKIPEFGEIYKVLWQLSRAKKNKKEELYFLTAYIEFQEIIEREYKELYPIIHSDFDMPELLTEKEAVISSLQEKNTLTTKGLKILILGVIFFAMVAIFLWFRSRYYRRQLEEIVNRVESGQSVTVKTPKVELEGISKEVIRDILQKLSTFEAENEFLDAKLTLSSLAKRLNTNSSYLSKVVNLHKEDNFSTYLGKLRIAYITKELINNEKMRSFKVRAIAQEAGFKNAETFGKFFRESNGMYPSRFIKQLAKRSPDL